MRKDDIKAILYACTDAIAAACLMAGCESKQLPAELMANCIKACDAGGPAGLFLAVGNVLIDLSKEMNGANP